MFVKNSFSKQQQITVDEGKSEKSRNLLEIFLTVWIEKVKNNKIVAKKKFWCLFGENQEGKIRGKVEMERDC